MTGLLRLVPARSTLRFLLKLDNWLYRLITDAAIRYGEGCHPKHRLTGYHTFFTSRIGPGERVLDLGCGHGVVDLDIVRATGAVVTGVDSNPAAIQWAQSHCRHERLKFIEADARLWLPEEPFDVVILSNVLEHLDGRVEFLTGVRDRARPRRMLIRVPMYEREWMVPLKAELGVEYVLDPTHRVEYTQDALLAEVGAAGLEVTEIIVRWGEFWVECRPSDRPAVAGPTTVRPDQRVTRGAKHE